MRALQFITLAPLVMLAGCISVHEGNAFASREEIIAHFRQQLRAEALELTAEGRDQLVGAGRNQTGPFTIQVKREHDQINFAGVYIGNVHGGFSGSWTWSRQYHAFLGFHQHKSAHEETFRSY